MRRRGQGGVGQQRRAGSRGSAVEQQALCSVAAVSHRHERLPSQSLQSGSHSCSQVPHAAATHHFSHDLLLQHHALQHLLQRAQQHLWGAGRGGKAAAVCKSGWC